VALLVEPSPLGKRRSRDVKDDPFLACALASRAGFIVTKDKDLLALEKPFGVEIVTPREFYRRLEFPAPRLTMDRRETSIAETL
jgi:predicted nucleic acid-binding protein